MLHFKSGHVVLAFALACATPCLSQTTQPASTPDQTSDHNAVQATATPQTTGTLNGTIIDASGAVVAGAHVKLSQAGQSASVEVLSGSDGSYLFSNVAAGSFQLTVVAKSFASQTSSGTLAPGEIQTVPPIALAVAVASTEVQVTPSRVEEAELEIKQEEKQRVLAVIPNFYVSYVPDAAPLNTRQKFQLAWKSTFDPVSFAIIGAVAGMEQAENQYEGYGQGAQGYGKRYGAALADNVSGSFIASFLLPSVFKQDPRYFYKGTGSTSSRFWYAMSSAVVCKGDNGHWQPNYSNIVGDFAAGAISNAYYPEADRGASLTVENALVGIGSSAIAAVFQEFVVKKFTPHSKKDQAKP